MSDFELWLHRNVMNHHLEENVLFAVHYEANH